MPFWCGYFCFKYLEITKIHRAIESDAFNDYLYIRQKIWLKKQRICWLILMVKFLGACNMIWKSFGCKKINFCIKRDEIFVVKIFKLSENFDDKNSIAFHGKVYFTDPKWLPDRFVCTQKFWHVIKITQEILLNT